MPIFINGTATFNNATSKIDCYITFTADSDASRSDDGSFMARSCSVKIDTKNFKKGAKYIELTHNDYGYLGSFYIQEIKTSTVIPIWSEIIAEIRPHYLSKVKANIEYDSNGNPIVIENELSEAIPCLYTKNSRANEIRTQEDGINFTYTFEISLDRNCEELHAGETIVLYDNHKNKICEGRVKGFTRKRFNSVVWV